MDTMNNRTITSTVRCSSIHQVRQAADSGKCWVFRAEFLGWTEKGNRSSKFWEISGRGSSQATVRWGRRGSSGRSQMIPFWEATDRACKKLDKGYRAQA
jgi:predicted DNA-binding WGR domain protein